MLHLSKWNKEVMAPGVPEVWPRLSPLSVAPSSGLNVWGQPPPKHLYSDGRTPGHRARPTMVGTPAVRVSLLWALCPVMTGGR